MQDKIQEIMGLVDAYAHHERMQDAEASVQCRELVESKLRELVRNDASREAAIKKMCGNRIKIVDALIQLNGGTATSVSENSGLSRGYTERALSALASKKIVMRVINGLGRSNETVFAIDTAPQNCGS